MCERADRRSATRSTASRNATIVAEQGSTTMECLVADISNSGARLLVKNPDAVPDRFGLTIATPVSRQVRRCRVVRRRPVELGVAFD
jgi:hypothetical protein